MLLAHEASRIEPAAAVGQTLDTPSWAPLVDAARAFADPGPGEEARGCWLPGGDSPASNFSPAPLTLGASRESDLGSCQCGESCEESVQTLESGQPWDFRSTGKGA